MLFFFSSFPSSLFQDNVLSGFTMTRIPELGVTLSVSRLDTALKERKSSSKRGRYTSLQRKAERSSNRGGFPVGCVELDSTSSNVHKSSLGQSEDCKKRSSKNNLDVTEGSEKFRISSTAAKISPRSTHNKEKCHRESVGKRDLGRESLRAETVPQGLCTDVDAVDEDDDDDEGDEHDKVSDAKALEKGEVKMRSCVTVRPRSDNRLSRSRRERTRNGRPSSGVESCPSQEMAPRPPNHQLVLPPSASEESGIPDGESEGPESKIRQIWRKELGLDDRPSRRLFVPKEYITGLAVGYPGQKAARSQKTVTTAVVPTAKLSVNEIQKRLKVLPPIDNKAKAKNSKDDAAEKPPAPNRVKDINVLAADLCRGATLEIGNSETVAMYRTYREARKDAFYFDLHSDIGSARSKYHRHCHAPPNSDDEDDDQGVQEVWNDSSYTRIVRIASPDTDGETVITHTVDASKVFDFGGRVIRKTQIDVFLPSDVQDDEIQSGNDDDDGDEDEKEDRCHPSNKNGTRVVKQHVGSKGQGNKRTNGEKDQLIENKQNSAAYEEDDEEDSDDDSSDDSSDSDDDDDDDDEEDY